MLNSMHPQKRGAGVDIITQQNPTTWRGNATRIELGSFDGKAARDLTGFTQIELLIRPDQTTEENLAHQLMTINTPTITIDDWVAGTAHHASADFTDAEMNLDLLFRATRDLWLVVTGIDPDGNEATLGTAIFRVVEDNNSTAPPPPENPGAGITRAAADERYASMADFAALQETVNNGGGGGGGDVTQPQLDVVRDIAQAAQQSADTAQQTADQAATSAELGDPDFNFAAEINGVLNIN